ncbi:efflux RND transporter periplasmic adaptor subunit [Psychroflexus sp. ALD_RP9]|uniref:efflux RND transporter periplasmic adaptor subunit n=1 Tax=Psychroflexus sp. ALD_RP9 TaxID=2777186 RepID=UPI001A8D2FDE|nr:efflux RND transporter periplasmic adaptor subunit [Psychroflexus sp. ALD_RP9]QSS96278.1 efflux RND transporter periplasmic adaptor subunit [Psychroflexus sp. ALD_RP9]
MKNLLNISLLSLLLITASCNEKQQTVEEVINSNDPELMRQKRTELSTQQRQLNASIEKLNQKIESFEEANSYSLVEVNQVDTITFNHYVEVQGDVQTDENILIYPEFSGVLEKIYVSEGDQVSKGQLLAKIDDGGLRDQLQELKTQLELSKTRFERQSRLWEQNIGSEIQYLEAETAYKSMKENVKRLQEQLNKTEIRAPFAGKIDQKLTDQGEVVSPGMSPVFRLINLNEMYISAEVPEQYLSAISLNTSVEVSLTSVNEIFSAEVIQISDYINPANRKFSIKISIPSGKKVVKPNLMAKVKINDYTNNNAIVVKESIMQETASGEQVIYVFQPENENIGTAEKVQVDIGKSYNGFTEIKNGLKPGQYVITSGSRSVRNGEKVRIETPLK